MESKKRKIVLRPCAPRLKVALIALILCSMAALVALTWIRGSILREAQALVRFREIPEVVDILDFIEENNTAYIVMEYVRGVDLENTSK